MPVRVAAGTRSSNKWRIASLATIPVPDESGVYSDLGWSSDFHRHYVKGKLIGQGSFGSVYLGIDLHTGKEVAVKAMPKQRGKLTKERTLQKLIKEVTIMQRLQDCPNVVRLLGLYETEAEVMLVLELCGGGDVQKLSDEVGALSEHAVALIIHEVLKVVAACHGHGVLHGDIKPANFVLKHRINNPLCSTDFDPPLMPWLRAIDFGCSQFLGDDRFSRRTGTPVYMAPEIFDRDYSWEADMWSVGIMAYQLYARRFPYWDTYAACRSAKLEEVAALVQRSPLRLDYGPWASMSRQGREFVAGCLQRDYEERLTVGEALSHPWFDRWLAPGGGAATLAAAARADSAGAHVAGAPTGGAHAGMVHSAGNLARAAVNVGLGAVAALVGNNIVPTPAAALAGADAAPRLPAPLPK